MNMGIYSITPNEKETETTMLITNCANTRSGRYDGFATSLLIGEINSGSKEISIQITEVEPNEMQFLHSHEQEQCYYIIKGTGLMIIDDEEAMVHAGDAVFIPSGCTHGIKNSGETVLSYLTANRSFGNQKEIEIWPVKNP